MATGEVRFFAAGIARPKGSHRAFVVAGRARVAPASTGERSWRDVVTAAARTAMQAHDMQPLTGLVSIVLEFYSLRPKSHFRAPGKRFVCPHGSECVHACRAPALRPGAQPRPSSAPDWDKLARSVGDALNGICYRDDALICEGVVRKRFVNPSQPFCGVSITVKPFDGEA